MGSQSEVSEDVLNFDTDSTKKAMNEKIKQHKDEIAKVELGKATPNLLKDVKISVYKGNSPLSAVSTITQRGPGLLAVNPSDPSIAEDIVSGIQSWNSDFVCRVEKSSILV